ncbi:hypothetical protein OG21DRAFT_1516612 [Imleria badia]|nr:hypothetical protein OG21DRAFT_1516612 [Imleria badia]
MVTTTFDPGYVMPAAVTMRSVAEHVQGRTTAYIDICGLHGEDKDKVEASLLIRRDITFPFIDWPPNSVASKSGPAWAGIDMMKCLPAKHIIYLDTGAQSLERAVENQPR